MRALGVVAMPPGGTFLSFDEISKRCNEYGKARALDRLKSSGDVSTLTEIQSDIDTCAAQLDRRRQLLQALGLVASLSAAGYLGFLVWRGSK